MTWDEDGTRTNTNKNASLLVQGDVRGTDSDVSMTAFCLIALQESRRLCAATVGVSTCPSPAFLASAKLSAGL